MQRFINKRLHLELLNEGGFKLTDKTGDVFIILYRHELNELNRIIEDEFKIPNVDFDDDIPF